MTTITPEIKQLRDFLIETKMKSLDQERRSSGHVKTTIGVKIQTLDAILIYIQTNMEEKDMAALKLTLDAKPVPTKQIKALSEQNEELTNALIEEAAKIPAGYSIPLNGVEAKKLASIASKMWALRDKGRLPQNIVPMQQKGMLYMRHLTPEELKKMQDRVGKLKKRRIGEPTE